MIGIAGCGRMGAPMLAALRRAGFDAKGFDIRPPCEFGDLESHVTDNVAEFSQNLGTLITVVRDISQTEDVLFGAQNFSTAKHVTRIIVCSTLSPSYVLGLRDQIPAHISLIDAPMSGAQIAAEEARLSFMLGGDNAQL
ncbi:MAG: NAD(P)-binding domain-containing protein [Aestuariivita sp.]|uniref:NAD(P)-binding domain-containing protein n=1 Tax=Aestuariivita sp. TaxID=1872407 RepID=UPI003BB054DD